MKGIIESQYWKAIYDDLLQLDYFSDSYLTFEEDFHRYYKGVDPLTFLVDDILLTMALKQTNYFRLHKTKSRDGQTIIFILKFAAQKKIPKLEFMNTRG